jgi:hypothetical protein
LRTGITLPKKMDYAYLRLFGNNKFPVGSYTKITELSLLL